MLGALPTRLYLVSAIGFVARLIAAAFSTGAFDYWRHRLPTAGCIAGGGTLYCDCECNHTPAYPYLSAVMFALSPDIAWLRAVLLLLPAALGDALISIALFVLLRKLGKERLGIAAATIYALNPVSIYEIRLAHWDGLTTFALLVSLYAVMLGRTKTSGVVLGLGTLLKQFPLVIAPIVAVTQRTLGKALLLGATACLVLGLGFLPFLIACPDVFLQSLSSHPLWQGSAPRGAGVGTVKQVFAELGVPQPVLVWAVMFTAMLGFPALRARDKSIFHVTGLVLVTIAYFTYATHRQLVVWALPFMIVLSLERRVMWPLVLVGVGYLVRVIKPDWYYGLVHLAAGAWYYVAFNASLAGSGRTTGKWRRFVLGHPPGP